MLVMLLGNVNSVKPLQPPKAQFPILVTLLGNVSSIKPLQDWNLLLVDYQCYTL